VAIKFIRPELGGEGDPAARTFQRRFEREAQVTAALRSPHTVVVYDFGSAQDGSFYYAMELLEGLDLETLINRFGPQPPERVVHFLLQLCNSLAEAHANGLVHRDIKPKNIFVTRMGLNYDFIKLLDFGLVKTLTPGDGMQLKLTIDGTTTGTPAFMSPELALGNAVDARADIYSLGCVAYWLLTGKLVFDGENPLEVLLAHIQDAPEPPSQRTEMEISPYLERVVLSCLEKRPEQRPQSAQELTRMLLSPPSMDSWDTRQAESWWNVHVPNMAGPQTVPLAAA
jgi:serine/threonine-protein kinase